MKKLMMILVLFAFCFSATAALQQDSTRTKQDTTKKDVKKKSTYKKDKEDKSKDSVKNKRLEIDTTIVPLEK
jgi:Ni/Co efflux regulator RcnB